MTSVSDDFGWFWAGEHRRDELLRDSVENLHAQLSRSSHQSSRLSSQLAALQGSLETRLTALSIAFDAYVELGDIREQLAGYPDTSQIRREVREALAAVADGRTAAPIDERGLSYWLPHATNAVLAIASGSVDREAEETARSLSPDSELFVVAAAGAIGRGAAVRERLPALLVGDGTLSPAQVALWRAAALGEFGDPEGVLVAIEPQWRSAVADQQDLAGWVGRQAGSGPVEIVAWIQSLAVGADTVGAQPVGAQTVGAQTVGRAGAPVDPGRAGTEALAGRTGLRQVVAELAAQGVGEEAELLRRARELRARIESPTAEAPEPDRRTAAESPEPVRPSVSELVRQTLLETPVGGSAHRVVLGWLTPSLLTVLDATEARAAQAPSFVESVTSPGGALEVTPSGADEAEIQHRVGTLRGLARPSSAGLYLFAGLGAAALVMAIVMVFVSSGASVLFFFLAAVGLIGAGYQFRARRAQEQEAERQVHRLRQQIEEARAVARAREERWRSELDQIRESARRARDALARPEAAVSASPALR